MKEIKRIFGGSDADMIESAKLIRDLLTQDLADFNAFSSRFDQGLLAQFKDKIDKAEAHISDNRVVAEQSTKTQAVNDSMREARKIYQRIKNSAEWAFEDEQASIVKEFTRGYTEAAYHQAKMIAFLKHLHQVALKYRRELTDPSMGGLPTQVIAEIRNIRIQLDQSNAQQEVVISSRPRITEERIQLMNDCYRFLVRINATAQNIYKEKPSKLGQYVFKTRGNSKDEDKYIGTILAGQSKKIATLTYDALQSIIFENTGTVSLTYDIVEANNSPNFQNTQIDSGEVDIKQMQDFFSGLAQDSPIEVWARNTSSNDGSYAFVISED